MTEADIARAYHAKELKRVTNVIADEMIAIAERLRKMGNQFDHLNEKQRPANPVVAELVSDYTQGTGNLGVRLWTLIRAAGDHDAVQADQP